MQCEFVFKSEQKQDLKFRVIIEKCDTENVRKALSKSYINTVENAREQTTFP